MENTSNKACCWQYKLLATQNVWSECVHQIFHFLLVYFEPSTFLLVIDHVFLHGTNSHIMVSVLLLV